MKVRNINWKKLAAVSIILNLLLIPTLAYVYAGNNSTFTISTGIYPGAPNYTIWKKGTTYYAKNAFGVIDFSGTNARQVIQSAIDSLTNGGTIYIKQGNYTIDSYLYITTSQIRITGETIGSDTTGVIGTILHYTGSVDAIRIGDNTNGIKWVVIENLAIIGSDSQNTYGIWARNPSQNIYRNLFIKNFNKTSDSAAILINATNVGSHFNTIEHLTTDVVYNGIIIDSNNDVGSNGNSIIGGNIVNNGLTTGPKLSCGVRVGHEIGGTGYGGGDTLKIISTSFQGFETAVKLLSWRADLTSMIGIRTEFVDYSVNITAPDAKWTQILGGSLNANVAEVTSSNIYWTMHTQTRLDINRTLGFKVPTLLNHPDNSTWDQSYEGFMWYCNEHSAIEFYVWTSTSQYIVYINSTGSGKL